MEVSIQFQLLIKVLLIENSKNMFDTLYTRVTQIWPSFLTF